MTRPFKPTQTILPRYEDDVLGLPAAAMAFTNSERKSAWCDRRWHFAYALRMKGAGNKAMSRGRWVHDALDALFTFYKHTDLPVPHDWARVCPLCKVRDQYDSDCPVCDGTGGGIVEICMESMRRDWWANQELSIEWDEEESRLSQMLQGYIERWGAYPLSDWKVVDTERAFACPVVSWRTGKIYRSKVPVVEEEGGWRMARPGDQFKQPIDEVLLPFYQVGRLDAVLQNRKTGDLLVHEFKTSANPTSFVRDLHLDTQIPGYMRLLNHGRHFADWFEGSGNVIGYQYDVISSRGWSRPKFLKSGKLSTAARTQASVPSWAWKKCVETPGIEAKHTDAEWDKIEALARESEFTVDQKLYLREFGTFDERLMRRFEMELFADAQRFAKMRRNSIRMSSGCERVNEDAVSAHFPRTAVCRVQGHGCDFKSICLHDSTEARRDFIESPALRWLSQNSLTQSEAPQTTEIKCPF
ncbi:MAG: hypothetical protein CMA63_06815 [Euryarchaeota archaeon]|nr:hypothetical protein [Euryarchaeota archaeon]|tara:strand:+ start:24167 stop:25576 length:1410 start_codon:yes stop_codon:yes gene_type:complete